MPVFRKPISQEESPPPRLPGWQLVGRVDRVINRDGEPVTTHHGGVCFLVKEDIPFQLSSIPLLAPNDLTTEASAIRISDPRLHKPITLVNLYVPPTRASDLRTQGFNPDFLPSSHDIIILGDVNAHHQSWDSTTQEDDLGYHIDDWAISNDLVILNDGSPTRISPRGVSTAPDVSLAH